MNEIWNAPVQRQFMPVEYTGWALTQQGKPSSADGADTPPPTHPLSTELQLCVAAHTAHMGLEGFYVLNVCASPNSCGEVLTPKVAELEGGAFRRWAERLFCSKPIKIVPFPSTGTVLEVGTIQSGQRQAKGSLPGSRCFQGNTSLLLGHSRRGALCHPWDDPRSAQDGSECWQPTLCSTADNKASRTTSPLGLLLWQDISLLFRPILDSFVTSRASYPIHVITFSFMDKNNTIQTDYVSCSQICC